MNFYNRNNMSAQERAGMTPGQHALRDSPELGECKELWVQKLWNLRGLRGQGL